MGLCRSGRRPLDHPRSRGVYYWVLVVGLLVAGSSPLARGLQEGVVLIVAKAGIIPARAGFTAPPSARRRSAPDHPRSRGVYVTTRPRRRNTAGSSPLARGLLVTPWGTIPARGIIPARAGFTDNPVG